MKQLGVNQSSGKDNGNDPVRLPSGKDLREATGGHFEIGPLHNGLEKGGSEPCWIEGLMNNIEK
jgi:hypothetical protein